MADAEDIRLSDGRRVNAWSATRKRLRHRREDLVRDAWILAIVDDLKPDAPLHVDGAVAEIHPEEVAVSRAVPNRPFRRKLVTLNGQGRAVGETPVANS